MTAPQPFSLGVFSVPDVPAPFAGLLRDEQVLALHDPALNLPGYGQPTGSLMPLLLDWEAGFARLRDALAQPAAALRWRPLSELRIHGPLSDTRQIICTGANYRRHVIDLVVAQGSGPGSEHMSIEERRASATKRIDDRARNGIPYAFPKLVGSLCGPMDDVVVPRDATQFDWELELGVVIGRPCWRVSRAQALSTVAGYLVINDLTRRELVYREDLKSLGSDWLRAKSGPGYTPHGPWLVPAAFVANPQDLRIRLELNGQAMQDESTSDMVFDIARQIEYLSSYVRLLPGDIIATGSPAGNGMHHGRFIQRGDVIDASISGLGAQRNRFIAEEEI